MKKTLLLLLRISRPEYNNTLVYEHKLYMNLQQNFRKANLNSGQYDKYEGAILKGPNIMNHIKNGQILTYKLDKNGIVYKDNKAFIFCMYAMTFDPALYDKNRGEYIYNISWDYIKPLWDNSGTEIMIIKNTSVFLDAFMLSAKNKGMKAESRIVKYDLKELLENDSYFYYALKSDFEAVYHKIDSYSEQNEYRLAVVGNNNDDDHLVLDLVTEQQILFTTCMLEYGKNIIIRITDMEFEEKTNLPKRFSANIELYAPEKPLERLY